jgi:hypothetical protein
MSELCSQNDLPYFPLPAPTTQSTAATCRAIFPVKIRLITSRLLAGLGLPDLENKDTVPFEFTMKTFIQTMNNFLNVSMAHEILRGYLYKKLLLAYLKFKFNEPSFVSPSTSL